MVIRHPDIPEMIEEWRMIEDASSTHISANVSNKVDLISFGLEGLIVIKVFAKLTHIDKLCQLHTFGSVVEAEGDLSAGIPLMDEVTHWHFVGVLAVKPCGQDREVFLHNFISAAKDVYFETNLKMKKGQGFLK
jgi:hypothetical protein